MKKVIIADDNRLSAEGIRENICWELLDAEVIFIAVNGNQVLEQMQRDKADLIISDIEMPDLDGISMSKRALNLNPQLKIILISAYDKFEYAKSAIRLGIFDYIEKPIDYSYLFQKIQMAFSAIEKEKRNLDLLQKSKPIMIDKFFTDLLYFSGNHARSHLKGYADFLDLNFEYSCFCSLKLIIENAGEIESEQGMSYYQMELYNMYDILKEELCLFDGFHIIKEFNGMNAIIFQNTKQPEHFIQVIHKCISSFLGKYENDIFKILVGIGNIVFSVWDINCSYESAKNALQYRFFFPRQNIFDAKECLCREFEIISFSEAKEEEFIRILSQKDFSQISVWLTGYFQESSNSFQAKDHLFLKVYSLLGKILSFLYKLNIEGSELEEEIRTLYIQFNKFNTLEELKGWMQEFCQKVCSRLENSINSYHNQICTMVIAYIRENFENHELCLNDISKYVNISPTYLSALYKKETGVSISDTITNFRIDKACQYISDSAMSIKEISYKCGYANQYYFSSSFKKKMGVSPSEYRSVHT